MKRTKLMVLAAMLLAAGLGVMGMLAAGNTRGEGIWLIFTSYTIVLIYCVLVSPFDSKRK